MNDENLNQIYEEILENQIDPQPFLELYELKDWQSLFHLGIKFDIQSLIEYLYTNHQAKFYLNDYTLQLDQNLIEHLNNSDLDVKNHCFKINVKLNQNKCYEYLLNMRKYSKLKRDEKGFYYIYS